MFYNFFALGDDEFEELSRDILSRELDQKMRIFGKGADQGIDIADCKDGRTIIAQCGSARKVAHFGSWPSMER